VIVYPAVDIRNGRCVQLTQGRPDTEVVHHDDPAAQAALWVSLGADAIHVVNLDGALSYGAGTASRAQPAAGGGDPPRRRRAACSSPVACATNATSRRRSASTWTGS
jgi:hypothetical protein